jgi:hypothetical protein
VTRTAARVVAFVAAAAVTALGGGMAVLYGLLVTGKVGQLGKPADAALLAGIGAGFAIAGLLGAATLLRRRGAELLPAVRMPAIWISLLTFGAAIGVGAFAVRSERFPGFDPALALAAVVGTFLFVARIVTRWGPRRVLTRAIFGPAAWGMTGAVAVALVLQIAFFGAIVGAVYLGLYAHDPDVAHAAWRDGIGDKIDHAGGAIAQTWTIGLAALVLYACVAPLTEEFAKFIGVLLVMRGRTLTRHRAFVAGASAGLGFAVLETLLYGLASADKWPLVIGLRAPVVFIHVTGTTLTALGWQLQRSRGGLALVWHYAAAVLVHGAWNALTVALLIGSATSEGGERVSLATGLTLLTVLSLMALLLMCCATWVVMNARRFGKADAAAEQQLAARAAALSTLRFERGGALQSVAAGEV